MRCCGPPGNPPAAGGRPSGKRRPRCSTSCGAYRLTSVSSHPFISARAAATTDFVSGGRLGIGASWLRSEWDAVGLDFDTRGALVDEAIGVCHRLWSEDVVEHHGKFFDFGPTAFEPKPVQQSLALHIGGDGPAALRRAAIVGTGWKPMNHRLEELPASIARLTELARAAGRATAIEVTVPGDVSTADAPGRYAAVGVTRLIVRPWAKSIEAIDGIRRFAAEFIPPAEESPAGRAERPSAGISGL